MASKPNINSSTTYHAEGNSMASSTQTVVGKGIPNPLTAEDLLKILRDVIPLFPPKSYTNSRPLNGRTIKGCIHFPNNRSELSCLKLTPLTVKLFPGGSC